MSNISLKKDFKNGEKLFDTQLNNNFKVIEAGVNANKTTLESTIEEADQRLQKELTDITADRGWDWNGGDRVTFYKGKNSEINQKPIKNGQLLYNTETGETALDDSGKRIITGSGNVIEIGNETPVNDATKLWINTTEKTYTDMKYKDGGKWNDALLKVAGDTLPIGAQVAFAGTTIPTDWLECNGQAVSRETYKDLFNVIGTSYGEGDGTTTFNLPDKRKRKSVGRDTSDSDFDTIGKTGGEKEHTLTINEMPSHKHVERFGANPWVDPSGSGTNVYGNTTTWGGAKNAKANETAMTGESQPHNNMDPYEVDCWIIKFANSIGVVDQVTTNISDTNDNAVPNAKTVKGYVDETHKFVPLWIGSELPAGKTYSLSSNIYKYRFVVIVAEWGNKITIPIIEGNTYLFGGCNYVSGSGTAMVTCGLSANITDSGNKVSVTNLKTMSHNQNSNHNTLENPKLLGIYGAI